MNALLKKMKKSNGWSFVLHPIVFFLLSLILVLSALGPTLSRSLGLLDLFFLERAPVFDEEAANIFTDTVRRDVNTLRRSDITLPTDGEIFGKIVIDSVKIDAPMIYGDHIRNLRRGVQVYSGTYVPGQDRTVVIGGHNDAHFRTLRNVKAGDRVELRTNYATYVYEITGSETIRYDDDSAYDLTRQEENLILFTCKYTGSVGATPYRMLVFAKYISGPKIIS